MSSVGSMRRPSADPDNLGLAERTFLIVDDEPHMLEIMADILRHFGAAAVTRAPSADAALAKCGAGAAFDCVISDFNMKPTNGLQLLQAIRQGARSKLRRDQRFVLVTGHGEVNVVRAAKALDVTAYLVKPVAMETIAKTLARVFTLEVTAKAPDFYAHVVLTGLQ